jgi:hypothetical protein
VNPFHGDIEAHVFIVTDIVNGNDVGVFELGGDLGFAEKSLGEVRLLSKLREKRFDHDLSVGMGIPCGENASHASSVDLLDILVTGEGLLFRIESWRELEASGISRGCEGGVQSRGVSGGNTTLRF